MKRILLASALLALAGPVAAQDDLVGFNSIARCLQTKEASGLSGEAIDAACRAEWAGWMNGCLQETHLDCATARRKVRDLALMPVEQEMKKCLADFDPAIVDSIARAMHQPPLTHYAQVQYCIHDWNTWHFLPSRKLAEDPTYKNGRPRSMPGNE
jgi:hypothetical protein